MTIGARLEDAQQGTTRSPLTPPSAGATPGNIPDCRTSAPHLSQWERSERASVPGEGHRRRGRGTGAGAGGITATHLTPGVAPHPSRADARATLPVPVRDRRVLPSGGTLPKRGAHPSPLAGRVAPPQAGSGGERRRRRGTVAPHEAPTARPPIALRLRPHRVMPGLDPAIHANTGGPERSATAAAPYLSQWERSERASVPGEGHCRRGRGTVAGAGGIAAASITPNVGPHPSRADARATLPVPVRDRRVLPSGGTLPKRGAHPSPLAGRVAPPQAGSGGERRHGRGTGAGAGGIAAPHITPGVGPHPSRADARATLPVPVRDGCALARGGTPFPERGAHSSLLAGRMGITTNDRSDVAP